MAAWAGARIARRLKTHFETHMGSRIEVAKNGLRRHLDVSRLMVGKDGENTMAFEDVASLFQVARGSHLGSPDVASKHGITGPQAASERGVREPLGVSGRGVRTCYLHMWRR